MLILSSVASSFTSMHALALWQEDSINSGNSKLLMIFVGLCALAMLIQAAMLVGIALGAKKAQVEIMSHITDIKAKVLPLVETSQTLIRDLTPEVKGIVSKTQTLVGDLTPEIKQITAKVHEISVKAAEISGHFAEVSAMAKDKALEFGPTISAANETLLKANQTAQDANVKAHQQVDRVNDMVSSVLDATNKMTRSIVHTVTQPGREVAGLFSGVKVAFSTLIDQYQKPKVRQYREPSGTYRPVTSINLAPPVQSKPVAEATSFPHGSYGEKKSDLEF